MTSSFDISWPIKWLLIEDCTGDVTLSNSSSFWASWRDVFGIWVLDFSPSHLQWAGHQIDPTWGQRYENPKYTIYRVLCQYSSLKVSKVWIKALLWERCQTWNKCDPTWPRELGHISLTKGHRGLKFSVYLENRNAAVQKNQLHLKRCGMQLRTTTWGCPPPQLRARVKCFCFFFVFFLIKYFTFSLVES